MKSLSLIGLLLAPLAVLGKRDAYLYVDDWSHGSTVLFPYLQKAATAGASHLIAAFVTPTSNAVALSDYLDTTGTWANAGASERQAVLDTFSQTGTKLILSMGGGNYGLSFQSLDAQQTCTNIGKHAKDFGYGGVDLDLEGFNQGSDSLMTWVSTCAKAARQQVNFITTAPQSPYLGLFLNYAYEKTLADFDKVLIQYYNQGTWTDNMSYDGLFKSNQDSDAVAQIKQRNPSMELQSKLVIGKYLYPAYGGSGQIDAQTLHGILQQAEANDGYKNGFMLWKLPNVDDQYSAQFLNTDLPTLLNGPSGTGGGSSNPPPPATTTTTTTSTTKSTTTSSLRRTQPPVVVPTQPHVVLPTQPPVVVPTQPHVVLPTQPPVVVPTQSHVVLPTQPPSNGGSVIDGCKAMIGWPGNADWDKHCKEMCEHYAEQPFWVFCDSTPSTAELLVQCVIKQFATACQHL